MQAETGDTDWKEVARLMRGDDDKSREENESRKNSNWRLLLQIDSDERGPGWMWGDAGTIYFWIREKDVAARQFDDVWLIFQCH